MDDENLALIQSILKEDEEIERRRRRAEAETQRNGDDHGWQPVINKKRNRKPTKGNSEKNSGDLVMDDVVGPSSSNVFSGIEQHYEERRSRFLEAQIAHESASADVDSARSKAHSDGNDDSGEEVQENGSLDVKKAKKKKKAKTPKVTVAEAASKMDANELATFLAEITVSIDFSSIFCSRFRSA